MHQSQWLRLAHLCLFSSLITGCTNLTYVNKPLNPNDAPIPDRRQNHTHAAIVNTSDCPTAATQPHSADGWFVGVAISGGGSRSANFAAAVMFELQRLGLLDKVDAISSVSGGSLPAAYYCLQPDAEWNPGNLQRKLTHEFASDMWWQLFMPWNTFMLMFSDYDRSDLMAAAFNRTLFTRDARTLTFADLRPDRPRLLINATDLQSGHRFVFANEAFDVINTDLAKYPIAYACAASSSVPVVLHQVTLRDYSTVFAQYRHFVDGGINDNLGVLSLLEAYKADNDAARAANRPPPHDKGAVLVIIDAGTQFNARLSDKGDVGLIEGLGFGAKLSSAKLLNRASTATLADLIVGYSPDGMTSDEIRRELADLQSSGIIQTKDRDNRPLTIVHIALARAATLKNAPYRNFGPTLDEIDTYFNISQANAYSLYQAANLIVKEKFEEPLTRVRAMIEK